MLSIAVMGVCAMTVFPRYRVVVGVSTLLWIVVGPLLSVAAAGSLLGFTAIRRVRRSAADERTVREGEVVAVEAVALGVSGGLSYEQAASIAAEAIGGTVGVEIERAMRDWTSGSVPKQASQLIGEMFAAAQMSKVTGARLADRLAGLAATARRDLAAADKQRLARLPVLLLFPLAFLILPGFVLLAVAPSVVGGLSRLGL